MTHSFAGHENTCSCSLSFSLISICLFNRSTCFWHCNHHLLILFFPFPSFVARYIHVVIIWTRLKNLKLLRDFFVENYTFVISYKNWNSFSCRSSLRAFLITAKFITTSIFGSAMASQRDCLRLINVSLEGSTMLSTVIIVAAIKKKVRHKRKSS